MTDLDRYESLLADWREKEEHAVRLREFRDTGGEHRLRVSIVQADPVLASAAAPVFERLMKGAGWKKMVDLAVLEAERASERAQHQLEAAARDAVIARSMS